LVVFITVTKRLDAASFTYSFDSLNRLTNAAYSDGSSESYSYDNAGNRLTRFTSALTTNLDQLPPTVPDNVTLDSSSPSQMSISWQPSHDLGYHLLNPDSYIDGSGMAGYNIYVNGSFVATTTITNFTLPGLYPDTSYCLTVAAFDHANNVSDQSSSVCYTTPVFQPPYLQSSAVVKGTFQFGVVGGTVGPYEILGSSNLVDWRDETNVWLPLTNNSFLPLAVRTNGAYFYRLKWSTNVP
jgi:hypothetical protein